MKKNKIFAVILAFALTLSACTQLLQTSSSAERMQSTLVNTSNLEDEVLLPDTTEMKREKKLTIAAIYPSNDLENLILNFNNTHPNYNVQVVDYADGGSITPDVAVSRLNTEIINGKYPDMICFSLISPYPYVSKGLLVDLNEYFDRDKEINIEDISIRNALSSYEGIFYISSTFNFETLVGRYSDFGERVGWTLSEYLNIEKSLPADVETIHNMTRESFINCIVSRYIRTAIDWNNNTCNFNTPEFISLLEAGARIRETPEDSANMSFGYGPTKVGEGCRVASLSWVEKVWKLAYEEQMAGCKLSFIGWPTVDGGCGSDVHLVEPVGIINYGANTDACWEFIKYALLNVDVKGNNLPVYMPLLQEKVEIAKKSDDNPIKISDFDADRLYNLIAEMKNIAIYDETVLDIIHKESASFFNGDKTAEEVAKIIQSKVSIYVAEQS